jgi:hypothetical protein
MMFSTLLVTVMAAFTMSANAAIVSMYSDKFCRDFVGERNVWDNTCAPERGFQSWRITTDGGGGQYIRSYSRNACVDPSTNCQDAQAKGFCHQAVNNDGGSNALGSSVLPCS